MAQSSKTEAEDEKFLQFHEMGLDNRILKAISKLGWSEPTLIQERAIPLALEGKDILARARTGSGKTAAFAIPIIQLILQRKQFAKVQSTKALVMAPTMELCRQITKNITQLTSSCSREIRCVDISVNGEIEAQRVLLVDKPDIIIGTPGRIKAHLEAENINLKESLELLAIDEADLVFSFGYEDDIKAIMSELPEYYQAFLMSATLSDEVKLLKKLALHNPVTLKLEEPLLPSTEQLTQYHIKCEEEEKFVIIYALLKLNLIRGKSIIFMTSVDRCLKMKLYLEQFAIQSCVLNCELPISSRCHIVSQFNEGLYDIIIASDDKTLSEPAAEAPKKGKFKRDKEYSSARGIDFQFVSNVINFDFPPNVNSYIHRVGRTARGTNNGSALSFISVSEIPIMKEVEEFLAKQSKAGHSIFKPFQFPMEKVEGFRYRSRDAYRAVTRVAIREARIKEIKRELLNSQKLKTYFEDNPRDLQVLRHDRTLHTIKIHKHLKDVPDYLVPEQIKHLADKPKKAKKDKTTVQLTRAERKFKKRKADPLKSLSFEGFKKKK
uniref:RNA helicase n=1 Tax=Strigamia maritima TaxID=126957 RepID=T1IZ77_STRMM